MLQMPISKHKHGQYFTPRHVAELMVSLLKTKKSGKVLEPSSGKGVFIDALLDRNFQNVTAIEIDPELAEHDKIDVINSSFISWNSTSKYDAVIGNPPYIRWKNLREADRDEVISSKHWGKLLNSLSDYLMVFIVNSVDNLNEGGELIFVTPSFWLHTQHSNSVRQYMLANGSFTELITFGETQVFPGVASSIIIFRYQRGSKKKSHIHHYQFVGSERVLPVQLNLDDYRQFKSEEIPQFEIGKHWTIASASVQEHSNKLETWASANHVTENLFGEIKVPNIGEKFHIANGMVSGLDKAFRLPDALKKCLTQNEKMALVKVTKAANLERLSTTNSTLYIDIPKNLSKREVEKLYPSLFEHLKKFEDDLEKRYQYVENSPFWEWSFRRSEKFFKNGKTKVFVPCKERITNRQNVRFSLVPKDVIATQDVTAIAPKEGTKETAEYLAAYLCLDQVSNWIRIRGLIKGGIAEFSERPLASIPFREIDWASDTEVKIHNEIAEIVKLTFKKKLDKENSIKSLHELFKKLGLP